MSDMVLLASKDGSKVAPAQGICQNPALWVIVQQEQSTEARFMPLSAGLQKIYICPQRNEDR